MVVRNLQYSNIVCAGLFVQNYYRPMAAGRSVVCLVAAVAVTLMTVTGPRAHGKPAVSACSLSEFPCTLQDAAAPRCIPAVRYCDGRRDCSDGSDEPQYCTREYPQSYEYYNNYYTK